MAVQLMKRICIFSIPIPASTFPNKIERVSSISDNIFRFIEPTILLDPPLKSQIMTEEIFGPLLPIITVRINYNNPPCCSHIILLNCFDLLFLQVNKIQESIEFINSRPKPLAIYAFTKDETFKRTILSETSSGSVTFNDTLVQVLL